jgi:integrase
MHNGEDRDRRRWLAPAQVDQILGHLDSPYREMAQLAAVTGWRVSEIVSLRRGDVHLNEGSVSITRNQGGQRSTSLLSMTARRILQDQLASHTSEWVFPNPRTGQPYSARRLGAKWRGAAATAGCDGGSVRDLRHFAAATLLRAGIPLRLVMVLSRSKTMRSTLRLAFPLFSRRGQHRRR